MTKEESIPLIGKCDSMNVPISINVEVVRYNKKRVDGKLHLSKHPVTGLYADCEYCREALARNLNDEINSKSRSSGSWNYYLRPVPILKIGGKVSVPISTISFNIFEIENREIWDYFDIDLDNRLDKLSQLIDYTLGIINVCMVGSPEEALRIKHLHGRSACNWEIEPDDHGDKLIFNYNRLSPWWVVSCPTLSLILQLFRGALYQCIRHPKITDELLSSIEKETMYDILNTMSVNRAMGIYRKYLVPYYMRCESIDNPFTSSGKRDIIERYFLQNRIFSLFPLRSMKKFWPLNENDFEEFPIYLDGCYGFEALYEDLSSPFERNFCVDGNYEPSMTVIEYLKRRHVKLEDA